MRTAKEWARQFPTDIISDAQIEPIIKRIQEDVIRDFKPVVEALQQVDQCGMEHFKAFSCACAGGIKQALAHAAKLMEGKSARRNHRKSLSGASPQGRFPHNAPQ